MPNCTMVRNGYFRPKQIFSFCGPFPCLWNPTCIMMMFTAACYSSLNMQARLSIALPLPSRVKRQRDIPTHWRLMKEEREGTCLLLCEIAHSGAVISRDYFTECPPIMQPRVWKERTFFLSVYIKKRDISRHRAWKIVISNVFLSYLPLSSGTFFKGHFPRSSSSSIASPLGINFMKRTQFGGGFDFRHVSQATRDLENAETNKYDGKHTEKVYVGYFKVWSYRI